MASFPVPVGSKTVNVVELTVLQVREWIAAVESGDIVDPLRALVLDDCTLDDLARMCDFSGDDLEQFTHAELLAIRDKARALNPHFFRVREALARVSLQITAGLASLDSTATSQS